MNIRGLFTDNWELKLVAVMMAALLEIYFYSPDNSVTSEIAASVDIKNLPSSMMVVAPKAGDEGHLVKATVRGPGPVVRQLEQSRHSYRVDVPTGSKKFIEKINPEKFRFNLGVSGVEIISVSPAEIEFELESVLRKELLLKVEADGKPKEGFELKNLSIRPAKVLARGPKSDLNKISEVALDTIDIAELDETKEFDLRIPSVNEFITYNVDVVTVKAQIVPVIKSKVYKGVEIKVLAPKGFAATISPSRANVEVSGPELELEKLEKTEIELVVDGRSLERGSHQVPLFVELPKEYQLIKTSPESVKINLVKGSKK